jgi:hypothetical protein
VLLNWKVIDVRNKKLSAKNTILKVYEVLARPIQMRLDGEKGDEIEMSPRPRRKIRGFE